MKQGDSCGEKVTGAKSHGCQAPAPPPFLVVRKGKSVAARETGAILVGARL